MASYATCPDCKGQGAVKETASFTNEDRKPCETCRGTGEVCTECFAPPQFFVGEHGETVGGCWHHY